MALNTVTLTWNLTDFLSTAIPDSCTLYLTPTSSLSDTADNKTIIGITRSTSFSGGTGSWAGIVANDNASLGPANSAYTIRVMDNVTGGTLIGPFTSPINHANGASQDLAFLYASQVTSVPFFQYVTAAAVTSLVNTALTPDLGTVYSVLAFGADPTGVTDSTAAINATILAVTGNLNPATNTRKPVGVVYLPTGTYKISSDLLIQSVAGFRFMGDGPELTFIKASGTGFTNGPITVDGSYAGRYEGFTILGDGTEQVNNAITLTWTTGASRSTTGNKFADIRIRNLNFVTGFNMAGVTNRQVDSTKLSCIVIGGLQTVGSWSNSGNWQQGFVFGNGTFANIYDQVLERCEASNVYYGFYNNVSSFTLTGAQPANNFCDFYMSPGAQSTITNVQSQNSSQLVFCPSNFSPQPNSFNDCQFKSNYLSNANNNAFITLAGGQWNFNNISAGATQLPITVASGSNGGTITNIAAWANPSPGVLSVSSSTGLPSSGTLTVATSTTAATISYTGTAAGQLTGCTYVSGGTGTVSTGGAVNMYVGATVSITGSTSVRPCTALFHNLTLNGLRTNAFTLSNAILAVTGYNNYNPNTGNYTFTSGDANALNVGGSWSALTGVIAPQVNYITATGTTSYTIPAGAATLDVTVVGGGAGGSSGAFATSGAAGGGAGGGGGGVSRQQFAASALTSPVSVSVGAGGGGGAAVSSPAAGNSGALGSSTTFGGYLWGQGGRNGSGGSALNTGVAAGGAGGVGTNVSGAGGSSVLTAAAPVGTTAQSTCGGGAGGGITATTVAAGSNGGTITNIASWGTPGAGILSVASITNLPTSGQVLVATSNTPALVAYTGVATGQLTGCTYVSGGTGTVATGGLVTSQTAQNGGATTAPALGTASNSSVGGIAGGASPTNGNAPAAQGDTAPGGGGGASAVSGAAQNGADARANSGGGGGGGGACSGGTASGAGGAGGSGFALIIAYFQ